MDTTHGRIKQVNVTHVRTKQRLDLFSCCVKSNILWLVCLQQFG
jgi:hypothetical protein